MSFSFNNVLYNALKICLESKKTENIQNTVERYVIFRRKKPNVWSHLNAKDVKLNKNDQWNVFSWKNNPENKAYYYNSELL